VYITADKGAEIALSEYLSDTERRTLLIWKSATAKKTVTAKQIYVVAPRAEIVETSISADKKGKFTLPKNIEIYDETK
jgi:hypothetical protein